MKNNKKILKRVSFYIIVFFIFILIAFYFNASYFPIGLLLVFGIFIYSLIRLIVSKYNKSTSSYNYSSWFITSFLAILTLFFIARIGNNITKKRAEFLIKSLEEFHQDHGYYPNNLNTLKGKYFKKIPKPVFYHSKEFIYNPISCETISKSKVENICEYKIAYFGKLETEAEYYSKTESWQFDD